MATLATEVAAITTNRHHLAIRLKVVNRLVADRLDFNRGNDTVGQVVKPTVAVHMRLAITALTMAQAASPQAQVAYHVAVFHWLLELSFNQLITVGHRGLSSEFTSVIQCNVRLG